MAKLAFLWKPRCGRDARAPKDNSNRIRYVTRLPDEISRLSEAEHIELIEAVWRTMLPNGSFPPLSDDEKSLPDERVRDAV